MVVSIATAQFQALASAYDVLGDEGKRKLYDASGRPIHLLHHMQRGRLRIFIQSALIDIVSNVIVMSFSLFSALSLGFLVICL